MTRRCRSSSTSSVTLGNPFCAVCSQTFVLRSHEGWGGIPASGVHPIDDVTPVPGTIRSARGVPLTFVATLLEAGKGLPDVQWFVDGAAADGATLATFIYTPIEGAHTVELRVTDPTPLVHPLMSRDALQSARTWIVEAQATWGKRRAVAH